MTTLKVYHFTSTKDMPSGKQYIIILMEILFATQPNFCIDKKVKKGGKMDWQDPVSYTHLTLPTNREV